MEGELEGTTTTLQLDDESLGAEQRPPGGRRGLQELVTLWPEVQA